MPNRLVAWRLPQGLRGTQETGGIYAALYKAPFRGLSSETGVPRCGNGESHE